MRGKRGYTAQRTHQYRITPADAGKTKRGVLFGGRTKDHPRGCGENMHRKYRYSGATGSPPRMRGKLLRQCSYRSLSRITPADAGKTGSIRKASPSTQDHPRGCGENKKIVTPSGMETGSPPRMRGKLFGRKFLGRRCGITPADAGKTCRRCCISSCTRDHPRGCGENTMPHIKV